MRIRALVLAATLLTTPFGLKAADLVVWWEEGQYAEEDQAVREIIAAFGQGSVKQVELVLGVAGLIGLFARLRGKGGVPPTSGGWRELEAPEFR